MSRYWDWQLGLSKITSHLQQRDVIPPRFKGTSRFAFFTTKKFCKTKGYKGSFTERILFISENTDNWKEFCQWTKTLLKMPEFKAGDELTFYDGVIVHVLEANPPEEPKVVTLRPIDPEVNLGQGQGKFQILKVKNIKPIKSHFRPVTP